MAVALSESGGLTRLVARMDAQPVGPMRLFAPLIARTMRSQFAANWLHLKYALEQLPSSAV
jgi:hypothetical protein